MKLTSSFSSALVYFFIFKFETLKYSVFSFFSFFGPQKYLYFKFSVCFENFQNFKILKCCWYFPCYKLHSSRSQKLTCKDVWTIPNKLADTYRVTTLRSITGTLTEASSNSTPTLIFSRYFSSPPVALICK